MKKLISVLISIGILMSISVNAFASTEAAVPTTHVTAIKQVLESAASEKELYGFEGIYLSTTWISAEIPAYEVCDGSFSRIDNIAFYPIVNTFGQLISIAAVVSDAYGVSASISSELISVLNDCFAISTNPRIALLYDDEGVYCWNGVSAVFLKDGISGCAPYRGRLSNVSETEFSCLETASIQKACQLNISNSIQPCGYEDEAAYVTAPVKRQPAGSYWCWAACMASVVQLEGKGNYTCTAMANRYTTSTTATASMDIVKDRLSSGFGLSFTHIQTNYLTHVLNSLGRGHAVIGGFIASYDLGHMMVVRGIDFSANTFSVMDPGASGSNYHVGSIVNRSGQYGTLRYVSTASGSVYNMIEYLYL
ncbi:MAG: C39 family peptidase [Oscillospiraceae bacterium]